ncbi:DNA (cytosine-5-)-methyltransferase [Dysgonomonas capnocytophagoides]|uniref:Cytosine-specific methyltransferase n=1 Tax=Dysgonomonas capnocytophagoides TaxID=45254 RepID=A0A4Y8L2I2_9BACT|nr:DNA (cytosine-5-)-methyltransferase [Dysgonomonas capnocytophagoides]TFD96855.1 DNA (cytosine-5-)-methyltransferase [Dysgonomonas capnocytophagoides]
MNSNKKKILSLFSCCGGMDIGFEGGFKILKETLNKNYHENWIEKEDEKYIHLKETGFITVFANDISEAAKITWCDYFGRKREIDVSDAYKVRSIVDIVKEYKEGNKNVFPKDVDIVTGGFPCQDFSVAGKRKGFNSHKDHNGKAIIDDIPSEETRGKLYMWMKEVIEITLPKIFIAENVKGLANLGEVKNIIQSDFSKIGDDGYLVLTPQVLHAGRYGVPQSRERIFFIGFKKSALTENALKELSKKTVTELFSPYPIPTHKISVDNEMPLFSEKKLENFVNCGKVLLDLDEPNETFDESQKYFSLAKYMGNHCQGQKEVNLEKLAPTIRSEHHGNIEFRRLSIENGGNNLEEIENGLTERRLTLRECARIQTFPDDFNFIITNDNSRKKFKVSPSVGYKLVGNAVPPLLAYHIAKKIEKNWDIYFKK